MPARRGTCGRHVSAASGSRPDAVVSSRHLSPAAGVVGRAGKSLHNPKDGAAGGHGCRADPAASEAHGRALRPMALAAVDRRGIAGRHLRPVGLARSPATGAVAAAARLGSLDGLAAGIASGAGPAVGFGHRVRDRGAAILSAGPARCLLDARSHGQLAHARLRHPGQSGFRCRLAVRRPAALRKPSAARPQALALGGGPGAANSGHSGDWLARVSGGFPGDGGGVSAIRRRPVEMARRRTAARGSPGLALARTPAGGYRRGPPVPGPRCREPLAGDPASWIRPGSVPHGVRPLAGGVVPDTLRRFPVAAIRRARGPRPQRLSRTGGGIRSGRAGRISHSFRSAAPASAATRCMGRAGRTVGHRSGGFPLPPARGMVPVLVVAIRHAQHCPEGP